MRPSKATGGMIVFQNLTLGRMGPLVASVGWLIRESVACVDAAGSTLACRTTEPLGPATGDRLEQEVRLDTALDLVDAAHEAGAPICEGNEPQRFLGRVPLTRAQLASQAADHAAAG